MKTRFLMMSLMGVGLFVSGCVIHDHGPSDRHHEVHQGRRRHVACTTQNAMKMNIAGKQAFAFQRLAVIRIKNGGHELCTSGHCVDVRECTHDRVRHRTFCGDGACELIVLEVDLDCPTAMFCTFDQLCEALPSGQCVIDGDCFDGGSCSALGSASNHPLDHRTPRTLDVV